MRELRSLATKTVCSMTVCVKPGKTQLRDRVNPKHSRNQELIIVVRCLFIIVQGKNRERQMIMG
ncbi:hypothetical protein CWATWH0003_3985 [Crocosphaera watsonii WH 0003]|uniref:Uncharacterized protein n=1 Tax=Crocosphaera watsonii WH 0003 TaxID=423471 RepID=G5J968_CROWT|nr:hypothetical protein CWATWH0003_3985 [Crocosphaera watsonii WH 0003]